MSDFLWLNGQQSARLLCPQDSPGNNIGAGLYWLYSRQEYWCALLQGIFLTQGLDPCLLCLLHWQSGSSPLVAPGKPTQCEWVPSNPLRDSAEPKGRGRTFSLAAWAGTSVFSCPQISALLFPGLWSQMRSYIIVPPPHPPLECFVNSIPSHWSHVGKNRNLVRNVSPLYSLFLHLSRSEDVTLTAAMRLLNLDWVGCWMDPGFTKACQLDSQGYLLTDSALGP